MSEVLDAMRNAAKNSSRLREFFIGAQRLGRILMTAALWIGASFMWPELHAQTWYWRTETVDQVGKFTSVATDAQGNVHLSYSGDGTVKYAFRPAGDKSKWFIMTLDNGDAYTNIALDSQDDPHICYTAHVLRYAHWDGSDWRKESIAPDQAEISYSCAIAVSPDGTPYISWYRAENADGTNYLHIKFAERRNRIWLIRTPDFDLQTGKWESMTLDTNGSPVLSFDAFVKGLLKYAYRMEDTWKVTTVDFRGHTNDVYNLGMGNSIATNKTGKPGISYEDGENLKYAELVGETWKIQVVDSFRPLGSWVGYRTSLKFDSQGRPHIAYETGGVLKHAYRDGQKWRIEILGEAGLQGYRYESMCIDPDDSIFISYTDPDDGSLKVAIGQFKTAVDTSPRSPRPRRQ